MQQKTFGKRSQSQIPPTPRRTAMSAAPLPAEIATATAPPVHPKVDDVDAELAQWNALRKARKRSFREPWRTASIVCGVGFGLSYWLLPDQVANIAELLSGGLSVAAIVAGIRAPRVAQDKPAAALD
jgi:hypothetical protein